ncbi:GntP family permease [Amorphoplanes digitatis]|uniref:GntP family gluconate:H+ symporter n=1 Tax=Actinoplanes digitatis TaxID=1868 RepID=A0A7W7MQ65_9ACTN|nr:SLC13 family permease [Actinoplanes digitatis]MBB4762876.1 GntP family gluconate:H+ symporter [Actinoplanes digitatis]GID91629.1 gluconate:H+ symporter, GntP family protein [Actinoplanes digitatis]
MTPPLAAEAITSAGTTQLILAAVFGIAVVVLLIAWAKWHPFLALILGAAALGVTAGAAPGATVTSFTTGVGSTVGSVGLLIALGSMIGALLAESGGADAIVTTMVRKVSGSALPWAMAGVAALIGLPLFFEVGVVLLVPIVVLAAQRTGLPLLKIGIPALAGLSVLHGLVPPHPGPLVAVSTLNADLGLTLALGLVCAIPTVIVAGPIFGNFISKRVPLAAPPALVPAGIDYQGRPGSGPAGGQDFVDRDDLVNAGAGEPDRPVDDTLPEGRRRPSVLAAVLTILLPIVLMLLRALGELTLPEDNRLRTALDVAGTPVVALLAGVLLAMWTLGKRAGFDRVQTSAVIGGSLPPIAGILLIVAAGGGFKQVLVDSGVGNVVANAAQDANMSALLLGYLVAVGIRVATGSATVATISAAGIVAPLATTLDKPSVSLLALAIGCGSLFFSHVNDAGFWLVKEYFGMTVGQTIKTWSVMETIISVFGFGCVMLLDVFI